MAPIPQREQDDPGKNQSDQNDISSLETPPFNIAIHSSSDSDGEEDVGVGGYQLLPQEPGESSDSEEDMEPEEQINNDSPITNSEAVPTQESFNENMDFGAFMHAGQPYMTVPDIVHGDRQERSEIWNKPIEQDDRLPLNEDKTEEVLAVMRGFSLPTTNIPTWAATVPEDDWRTKLFMKLHGKSSPSTSDSDNNTKISASNSFGDKT